MKLFEAAKLSGKMIQSAAIAVAHELAIEEDKQMLLSVSKRRLQLELRKTDQSLIEMTNWGPSFPAQAHQELSERRSLISFLINPAQFQGTASIR